MNATRAGAARAASAPRAQRRAAGGPHCGAGPGGFCEPRRAAATPRARAGRRRPRALGDGGGDGGAGTSVREADAGAVIPSVCNDFVCVSSPQVERVLRQFMQDLEACRDGENGMLFAEDLTYRDPLMRLGGRRAMREFNFTRDEMVAPAGAPPAALDALRPAAAPAGPGAGGRPAVRVERAEASGNDSVLVEYAVVGRLRGPLEAMLPELLGPEVRVRYAADLTFNLISGRVSAMAVTWDLGGAGPLGAAAFLLARARYSAARAGASLSASVRRLVDGLDADDGGQSSFTVDPRDPNKFFQQQDNTFNDAVQFSIGLLLMYTLVKALTILNT